MMIILLIILILITVILIIFARTRARPRGRHVREEVDEVHRAESGLHGARLRFHSRTMHKANDNATNNNTNNNNIVVTNAKNWSVARLRTMAVVAVIAAVAAIAIIAIIAITHVIATILSHAASFLPGLVVSSARGDTKTALSCCECSQCKPRERPQRAYMLSFLSVSACSKTPRSEV